MSFKSKIVGICLLAIVLTGGVIEGIVVLQKRSLDAKICAEVAHLGRQECERVVKDVYRILDTTDSRLRKQLQSCLRFARLTLDRTGQIDFAQETVAWATVNQFSQNREEVKLPKMLVGRQWLGQNRDFKQPSLVVDEVTKVCEASCTIFQRMNDAGDMLRICTSVQGKDGNRAVGTFIPAVASNGSPNAVLASVLKGQTYVGRAKVVNDWCITAYEPLFDAKQRVVGMLFCGIKQDDLKELHAAISSMQVGKTGYVFVLAGAGDNKGEYIISQHGQRDGENIWNCKDADGKLFVQSTINEAKAIKEGECAFLHYAWRNPDDPQARQKMAATTYFTSWDWVVGASAYDEDFQDALLMLNQGINRLILWSAGGALIAMVVFGAVAWWFANRLGRPLTQTVVVMEKVAAGDYSQRLGITSKDEFGRMAHAVNQAVQAAERAIQQVHEGAQREKELQAQRVEEERVRNEEKQRRQDEEAAHQRERMDAERRLQEEQSERDRQQAQRERVAAEQLRKKIDALLQVVNAAAQGDLTQEIPAGGSEAIDELAGGIRQMLTNLAGIVGEVTQGAVQFHEGSRLIADSSQSVAQGAQTQIASIEEMNASIKQLVESIEGVKQSSQEADQEAKRADRLAEQGGKAVEKSVEAMRLIRASSQQISEIIQVISEIASQTNLLALNAAIEAARAGEHGMGFAVVADEVRKLAERSNQAAGEIAKLIKESGQRVEEGSQLSDEAGNSLKEIVGGVAATVAKISEIASATLAQSANAQEVSKAIAGVAQITEQNSADSEEMAASSEQLGAQAASLKELVQRFKLKA